MPMTRKPRFLKLKTTDNSLTSDLISNDNTATLFVIIYNSGGI